MRLRRQVGRPELDHGRTIRPEVNGEHGAVSAILISHRLAIALPMPREAPVTRATRPSSLPVLVLVTKAFPVYALTLTDSILNSPRDEQITRNIGDHEAPA